MKQLFLALADLANGCSKYSAQRPLPKFVTAGLLQKWPRIKSATDPCRLQYCTQQIVVCRADLITKFCRNTIHFPDIDQLDNHFARTLICQGMLSPVHPIALPIYWNYDAALSLYPLPDLVVVGDPNHPFNITQHGCTIINTARTFIKTKFSFKVYVPSTKTVEDSEIPDEDS